MADLSDVQASGVTRLVGSDATGLENTPVQASTAGGLHVNLRDNAGSEEGIRTNPLQVSQPNLISTANSTSVALGANAVFTGTAEDVTDYASIGIQVFTNQASTANGFTMQQSVDGTNWDDSDVYTLTAMAAGAGKFFVVPVAARFFRVVYTNGAVAQTLFRLQTIFHRNQVTQSSHRIEDALDGQNDGELNNAILKARRLDGSFDNVKQSNNNELRNADILDAGTGTQSAFTVGLTALPLRVGGANLANRKYVTIHNNSLVTMYWGYTNAVTTTTGTPILAGQPMGWAVGINQDIYVVAGTAALNARITEGA